MVEVDTGALVAQDGLQFVGIEGSSWRFETEAPDELVLEATSPDSSTSAGITPVLLMQFSEPVVASAEGSLRVLRTESNELVEVVRLADATAVSISENLVTVALTGPLDYATQYHVLLDEGAIRSASGTGFEGVSDPKRFTFTTIAPPTLTLERSSPAELGVPVSGVATDSPLVFTFSDPITAGRGAVTVRRTSDDSVVMTIDITDAGVVIRGDTVTITLPEELEVGTTFSITLDEGLVVGTDGAIFAGVTDNKALVFTTADVALPEVVLTSSTPSNGARDVEVNTSITLNFDVNVVTNQGKLAVLDATTATSLAEVDIPSPGVSVSGKRVTIELNVSLPGSREVTVNLSAGAVKGETGATFPGITPGTLTFTTASSFGVTTLSPLGTEVEPDVNLVLTFSEPPVAGQGDIVVRSGSALVETVNVESDRVRIDGNTATIDLDVILAGETEFDIEVPRGSFESASDGTALEAVDDNTWTFETKAQTFPAGINIGLMLWLDASYAPSVKGSPNAHLWADRSGQYRNLMQASASRAPNTGSATLNGLNVLHFDGNDDLLQAASALNSSNLNGFIVWRSDESPSATEERPVLASSPTYRLDHGRWSGSGPEFAGCVGTACPSGQWYTASFLPVPSANAPSVWEFGYTSQPTSLFTRSNAGATQRQSGPTAPLATATEPLTVGGMLTDCDNGCFFEGHVAEVLLYSVPLSASQRLDVTQYLYAKWMAPAGECASGERRAPNGRCYFSPSAGAASNWLDARSACQARGTGWDLASVRNELDHRFLTEEMLSAGTPVWFGARNGYPDDVWRWSVDGAAFWTGKANGVAPGGVFTAWESDQPNDLVNESRCIRYRNAGGSWGWSDAACTDLHSYVCEGPADVVQ